MTEAGLDLPKKSSKKSKDTITKAVEAAKADLTVKESSAVEVPSDLVSQINVDVSAPKKSRKRAADFLKDGDGAEATTIEEPVASGTGGDEKEKRKRHKKSKKSKKDEDSAETLTADGVNGVVEHTATEVLKVKTSKKSKANSMQAEADRTQEDELEEEFRPADKSDPDDEADEGGVALLAGFDTDGSDNAEDQDVDLSKTPALPDHKKTQKKLRRAQEKAGEDEGTGAIYVGRVPHGFYEQQMQAFFAQFGEITKLRLSRNKRTGASKHFAFVEFKHKEVAKIAAETMDNYLMYGHILKAKFAPEETLHPDVWKGANKKFRKIPHAKLEKGELEAPKSEEQWRKKNVREQKKREKKAKKLQELMGLDIAPVELKDPSEAIEEKRLAAPDEEPKQLTNGEVHEEIAKAVEAAEEAEHAETKASEGPVKAKKKRSKKARKAENPEAHIGVVDEPVIEQVEKEAEAVQVRSEAAAESATEITKTPLEKASNTKEKKPSPFRDASGKYIPPLQRKQLARAKYAKDHPEEHRQKKKAVLSDKMVRRQEKKDKRKEKLKEKFGARNVKGGDKYKTGGKKERRKAERAASRAGGAKTAE